jgi:hypothetical protein
MTAHICPECLLLHDSPAAPQESEAIVLARIAMQQAVEVERIRSRSDERIATAMAEAEQETAETQADAAVESAAIEAELLGDAIEASDIDPAEIIVPAEPVDEVPDEPEDAPPPSEESPVPEMHHKPRGLGMW